MDLFAPLTLTSGGTLKNRFVLAPLTNMQSQPDGRLGDDEYRWLCKRAEGGFGLTMTCAAYVQKEGIGFAGQLGIYSDEHVEGLTRLVEGLKRHSTFAIAQLYHGGMRSPSALTGRPPQCPSDHAETGAQAMTTSEIAKAIDDFVDAARRAERAGFDGVEIHGAHGYLVCEFLSPEINQRTDAYGGSLDNRSRFLFEIVDGVRASCGSRFTLGVRLSPERFGLLLDDIRAVAERLMRERRIDFLDLSLWDVFKEPNDEPFKGRSLLSYFTDLNRGSVRLGAAGKIASGSDAARALASNLDFVVIGRAAILHHDLPKRVLASPTFEPVALPVSADYLRSEGLGEPFISYMRTWKGFVEPAPASDLAAATSATR
jgi:2,4-dienoyl-CoA reductase-like NADH-dependent reductase (Old Yellow Enzyme family)